MIGIIVFIFGVIIGSFLNVVICRVPKNENIAYPGSHCPKCKRPVKAYENIPIISYVFLKGKCAGCYQKISLIYPAIEFLTGIIFYMIYRTYGISAEMGINIVAACILIVIFFIDLEHYIIPDSTVMALLLVAVTRLFMTNHISMINALISGVITFLFFYLIFIMSKEKFGGGDVKLFTVLGLFFGWPYINILIILASVVGLIVGLLLMALGKIKKNEPVPFGPFIALAALALILYGDLIWRGYERILEVLLF